MSSAPASFWPSGCVWASSSSLNSSLLVPAPSSWSSSSKRIPSSSPSVSESRASCQSLSPKLKSSSGSDPKRRSRLRASRKLSESKSSIETSCAARIEVDVVTADASGIGCSG
ncbi:hypothetical protein PF010_g33026 [Phytophthora fragariae]|uniref:Uncharacterized protein n=1 Tax=Phytophthora fragariae TaxID=53985 RepID=A0A6G0JCT9_9STRA|nr:hypothetical protein PF010_g33026 [Phytophthora fragariae]